MKRGSRWKFLQEYIDQEKKLTLGGDPVGAHISQNLLILFRRLHQSIVKGGSWGVPFAPSLFSSPAGMTK